jgi:hypothetical protein
MTFSEAPGVTAREAQLLKLLDAALNALADVGHAYRNNRPTLDYYLKRAVRAADDLVTTRDAIVIDAIGEEE